MARFREALMFAAQLHHGQVRKGSGTPYIAHLLGVASIVLENGGDEDQAIAALLHDAVEDQGGAAARERIRALFGERVTAIVDACTDSDATPKPPWRARKEAYLRHLPDAPADARLVSLADKLYNARAIVSDLRTQGAPLWARFTGGKEGTLWYYNALAEIFTQIGPAALAADLRRAVGEMNHLAAQTEEERSLPSAENWL